PFVRRGRFRLPARETWLVFLYFAAFTLFCAANQYSQLQWTTGIRYLVPTIPGLLLLSLQLLATLPAAVRRIAIAASVLLAWIPAVTYASVRVLFSTRQFRLTWLERMSEYGAVSHPSTVTAAVLIATAALCAAIWCPEIARRFTSR